MTLDSRTYLEHLRAYVDKRYVMHDGTDGEVILREKYFSATGTRAKTRKIRLLLPGPGLAFKLDHDQVKSQRKTSKPPLFHFLNDNAKLWSQRCDFVIFYVKQQSLYADCIEFKSGSINGPAAREQLRAGFCWVKSLKKIIEIYTADTRRIHVRKFLFGNKENVNAYLDQNRQLNADPSIRYYHFNEVQNQHLDKLDSSAQII